jgi:protein-L-isoaspartate(D-aspartate) O-methyltransferase
MMTLILSGITADQTLDYAMQRDQMVRNQIENRGISDPDVLNAMRKVERHLFVPDHYRDRSYVDGPLPIEEGQTISQPYIVALMTELLSVNKKSKVLEIGTGSGYQAAILGELCAEVYSIEIIETLYTSATARLQSLGYSHVHTRCGDGFSGWPEKAPFDGIVVTCAPKKVPSPLIEQLAEGGRLVIPVGQFWQELMVLEKINGKVEKRDIIPVRFVPMTGKAQGM